MFSVFRWIVATDNPICDPLASFSKRCINAGTGDHDGSEQLLSQHQRGVSCQQLLQQQSWWAVPMDRWNGGAVQVHPREAVCHAVSCFRIRTQRCRQHQAASWLGVIHYISHDVCGVTDLMIKSIYFQALSLFCSIFVFKSATEASIKSFIDSVRVVVLYDLMSAVLGWPKVSSPNMSYHTQKNYSEKCNCLCWHVPNEHLAAIIIILLQEPAPQRGKTRCNKTVFKIFTEVKDNS